MKTSLKPVVVSLLFVAIVGIAAGPAHCVIEATRISDFGTGRPCSVRSLNGGLFLLVGAATHKEVWFSDGTPAGTVFVKALPDVTAEDHWLNIDNVVRAGNGVVFDYYEMFEGPDVGSCPEVGVCSIWVSDGTTAGTVMLAGGEHLHMDGVGAIGDVACFYTYDNGTYNFWRTDGTVAGTYVIKPDFTADSGPEMDNVLYFTGKSSGDSRYSLWRTDGTVEGTYTLLPEGAGCVNDFVEMGGIMYSRATSGTELYRLFRTDGTVEGTFALQPEGSYCENVLSAVNNLLYFQGQTNEGAKGLFRSDGTPAGTYRISEISTSAYFSIGRPVAAGNHSVFTVYTSLGDYSLWGTDGTSEGTGPLIQTAQWRYLKYITALGDAAYFLLEDGAGGSGLWKTDGTAAGTELVLFFEQGLADLMMVIDGRLCFCCEFRTEEYEIIVYTSDGTAAGTVPLGGPLPMKDFNGQDTIGAEESAPTKCTPPEPVREFWSQHGLIHLTWDDQLFALYGTQFQRVVLHDSALDVFGYTNNYPVVLGDTLFYGCWNGLWAVSTNFRFTRTPYAPWREVGDPLVLNVACAGYIGTISYQWFKDGGLIDGATSAEFRIDSVTEDDEGWYSCRVTDTSKAVYETEPVLVEIFEEGSLPAAGSLALFALAAACTIGAARAIKRRKN